MGIQKQSGFDKYLGFPERIGRNRYDAFSYLVQRVISKLDNWYTKLLSPAGKEVLIKAVATALPTYTMSCFLLPKKLLHRLTVAIRNFLWSSNAHSRSIPWIAWDKIIHSKAQGDLGIRDLHLFNLALLAKQGWRLMSCPESLFAQIYKAKYYNFVSFLQARQGRQASFVWRGIIQTQSLLRYGSRWRVGNGTAINVWSDNWMPLLPSRPAQGQKAANDPSLTVRDLFLPGTSIWNWDKIRSCLNPQDIPLVQQLRPSHFQVPDRLSWSFTNTGEYTVKSGYYILLNYLNVKKESGSSDQGDLPPHPSFYKTIWRLHIPPKLKFFWWRVIHQIIPVASALQLRGCKVEWKCLFCGEAEETVNHLLFQCRLSCEIWELAPLATPCTQDLHNQTLYQNLRFFLCPAGTSTVVNTLFLFVGWRIWKARNSLLFRNKRITIPQTISKAISDHQVWNTAQQSCPQASEVALPHRQFQLQNVADFSARNRQFYCLVDASWNNPSEPIGVGWILYHSNGQCLLTGMTSAAPTTNPLEAEAYALLTAVSELCKLQFTGITFLGDCQLLYLAIRQLMERPSSVDMLPSVIAIPIQDIVASVRPNCDFTFSYVSRQFLTMVDRIVKLARKKQMVCKIIWNTL